MITKFQGNRKKGRRNYVRSDLKKTPVTDILEILQTTGINVDISVSRIEGIMPNDVDIGSVYYLLPFRQEL